MGSPTVGSNGCEPLRLARQAADALGLPVMVHVGIGPPDLTEVLDELRPGDIVTHCCTGHSMSLVGQENRVLDAARRARDQGVIFDVGHGAGSFSFRTAELMLAEGFAPDIISSDIHHLSRYGNLGLSRRQTTVSPTTFNERAGTRSICCHAWYEAAPLLGMPLADVVSAVTERPARGIGPLPRDRRVACRWSGGPLHVAAGGRPVRLLRHLRRVPTGDASLSCGRDARQWPGAGRGPGELRGSTALGPIQVGRQAARYSPGNARRAAEGMACGVDQRDRQRANPQ